MITGAPSFWKENFLEIASEESRRGQKGLSKVGISAGDASAGSHKEVWSELDQSGSHLEAKGGRPLVCIPLPASYWYRPVTGSPVWAGGVIISPARELSYIRQCSRKKSAAGEWVHWPGKGGPDKAPESSTSLPLGGSWPSVGDRQ